MIEKDFIPLTDTPYVNKLAKDYLLGKNIGIENTPPKNYEEIAQKAFFRNFDSTKRNLLTNVLFEQYKEANVELEVDSQVYKNILALKDSNTFTFTTGQQIHIFLGPLFFIYKIQSLLRHVQNFNKKDNSIKIVPIFWMATEDHDLDEINHVKLYGETFTWTPEKGNAVGRIKCGGLTELIDRIEDRADKSEENKQLFELLRKHYSGEQTLANATRSLLNEIFGEDGLIIINPDDKELKQSFSTIAHNEISGKILYHSYNDKNISMKKSGYESRVNAQEINYFWLENNKRIKLKTKDNKILKGDTNEELDLDEIIQKIEQLSPNVISRPLYQETILPNLLYLGGNAEIEYWLPLKKTFIELGLSFPALMQRDSALILTQKNVNIIKKEGVEWFELFREEQDLATIYFNNSGIKNNLLIQKAESIKSLLLELKLELENNQIKNATLFRGIKNNQKEFANLMVLINDELLKQQKENKSFSNLLKLKSKFFDSKQERNEFIINYPKALKLRFSRTTDYKAFLYLFEQSILK